MNNLQIRTKLALWFILITALLLLFSRFFIYANFSKYIQEEYHKTLESKALMTLAMLQKNNYEFNTPGDQIEQSEIALPFKENIIIYNSNKQKVFSFRKEKEISKNILETIHKDERYRFVDDDFNCIGITYTTNKGIELLVIAKGHFMSAELERLSNILIYSFFLLLFFTALGGYYFANKTLKPLTKTMNEIDEILPTDLSKDSK